MKEKIIYVDFIKKRRITFIHFIINKIAALLISKLRIFKTTSSEHIYVSKKKRISN